MVQKKSDLVYLLCVLIPDLCLYLLMWQGSEKKDLTPIGLRKKAAEFAKETVQKQLESFQRYGTRV